MKTNLTVLSNIIEQAIINNVDFVLLAGDNFHQNRPSLKYRNIFRTDETVRKNHIPVFIIFGNHDFYQKSGIGSPFLKCPFIYIRNGRDKITIKVEKLSLSGFSYRQPWIQRQMMEFPSRELTDYHIGLYHGEPGVSQRKLCSFPTLKDARKGYDYWALGISMCQRS